MYIDPEITAYTLFILHIFKYIDKFVTTIVVSFYILINIALINLKVLIRMHIKSLFAVLGSASGVLSYTTSCPDLGYQDKTDCSAAVALLQGSYHCGNSFGACAELEEAGSCPLFCCPSSTSYTTVQATDIIPAINMAIENCGDSTTPLADFGDYSVRAGNVS